MNRHSFKQMLEELNPQEVAAHSVLNHHVEGMDYLCLHRSPKLTVKLYLIDPARIGKTSGSILVTPHTHRYAFESTVLAGKLIHETFAEGADLEYDRFIYEPQTKIRIGAGAVGLLRRSAVAHLALSDNDSYWVGTDDIHTLIVPDRPVLLGLIQFADTSPTSTVYLRKGTEMVFPQSRAPSPIEAWALRNQALKMMEVV
ncbi:hypothetical protein SB778_03905 [Paraburkholderia sp. SIMBA_050]